MIPAFSPDGFLPFGLHGASLQKIEARFGGNARREGQLRLLREVVNAALVYPSVKRVLVWGSFVSNKAEPNDLNYSLVVGISHPPVQVQEEHRRFLVPRDARLFYNVDTSYLLVEDWQFEASVGLLEFFSTPRYNTRCGIIEISLRGEERNA